MIKIQEFPWKITHENIFATNSDKQISNTKFTI